MAYTSVPFDFGRKLKLYARFGVQEVWVLNVQTDTLHFFRSRTDLGYGEETTTKKPGVILLPSLGLTVDLSGPHAGLDRHHMRMTILPRKSPDSIS